jgi:ribosomal protein S27AE
MAVALPSLDVLGRRVGQGPAAVATVAVLAVAFIAGLRFARAPCARCGQPFFMPSVMNVLRSTCVHCGVAQWAEVDPGDGA